MEQQAPLNPILQTLKARIPGETFRLPSMGVFYLNHELADDVKNGEVHVFPLTAIDEIILKTPDKLLSGNAISDVFSRCIPQVLKPLELLSKDIDYLLMCLRLISYGDTVDIIYQHNCDGAKERTYSVELRPLIAKAVPIDPTSIGTVFTVKLPSDQTVVMRPPLYGGILQLYISNFQLQNEMSSTDRELISQNQLLDIMTSTIVSVDGYDDRTMIREWVRELPAGWVDVLSAATHRFSDWGPSTSWKTTCKDCGAELEIEIPLNPVAFFS